jgi:hypothetical protein
MLATAVLAVVGLAWEAAVVLADQCGRPGCGCAVSGVCVPNRTTFGYYQGRWRRWPGVAVQEAIDTAAQRQAAPPADLPAVEVPPPDEEGTGGPATTIDQAEAGTELPGSPRSSVDPPPIPPRDPGDAVPSPPNSLMRSGQTPAASESVLFWPKIPAAADPAAGDRTSSSDSDAEHLTAELSNETAVERLGQFMPRRNPLRSSRSSQSTADGAESIPQEATSQVRPAVYEESTKHTVPPGVSKGEHRFALPEPPAADRLRPVPAGRSSDGKRDDADAVDDKQEHASEAKIDRYQVKVRTSLAPKKSAATPDPLRPEGLNISPSNPLRSE